MSALSNRWFRCTVCIDFDICTDCHANKCHVKHWEYIHQFNYPKNCNDGYCDSCGYKFRPHCSTFQVFHCPSCEDYAICRQCKNQGMHVNHQFKMKWIPASDYLLLIQGKGSHHGDWVIEVWISRGYQDGNFRFCLWDYEQEHCSGLDLAYAQTKSYYELSILLIFQFLQCRSMYLYALPMLFQHWWPLYS